MADSFYNVVVPDLKPVALKTDYRIKNTITALEPTSPATSDALNALGLVPIFGGITSIILPDIKLVPSAALTQPTISMPTKPTALNADLAVNAPAFNSPTLPASPVISLPTAPVFESITLPTMPTFTMPTFTDALPEVTIGEPINSFMFVEQSYTSGLLDLLRDRLAVGLATATTGIELDEVGLLERLRERERTNSGAMSAVVAQRMAEMSSLLPLTVMAAQRNIASHRARQREASVEQDIKLKRNDMLVNRRNFVLGAAADHERSQQSTYSKKQARVLSAARSLADFALRTFDARVSYFKMQLERYKIAAAVYETRIRASLSALDLYKTQIAATRLSVDVQRAYAEVYNAQLEGVQAMIGIYKTRMEAAGVAASVERLRLEGFQATIEAYTAQVNAKAAEVRQYEASVRGETAKVSVYQATIDAYKSTIATYRVNAQARDVVERAKLSNAELKIEAYKADLGEFDAQLATVKAKIKYAAGQYANEIEYYSAQSDSEIATQIAQADFAEACARINIALASLFKDYTLGVGRLAVGKAQLRSRESVARADVDNSKDMAVADIISAEFITTIQNQSSELIATAQNQTNENIAAGNVITAESVALANIWVTTSIGTADIETTEFVTLVGMYSNEISVVSNQNLTIAKSNADVNLAAVDIQIASA